MKSTILLLPAALALLTAPAAHAVIYAYEGFTGYAAGDLSGQAINANTIGLNTATNITSAGTGALSNDYQSSGLTFSDMIVSGGSGRFNDATGRASYIGFAYNGDTVSGTLYSSYLVNLETAQNGVSVVSLRLNTTSTTGGASSYFHTYADSNGTTFTGSQYDLANTASTQTLASGTIYAVIGRFSNVGAALSTSTPGVATTIVLSAAQFDNFKAGGFSDAELDAAAIGTGPADVTSRISDANVTTGSFALTSGRGIQFGPGNAGVLQQVSYDELRFGSTLDDVLPVLVPEPSVSLALLAAFGVLAGVRRRA